MRFKLAQVHRTGDMYPRQGEPRQLGSKASTRIYKGAGKPGAFSHLALPIRD
jgi:hypothetical protein